MRWIPTLSAAVLCLSLSATAQAEDKPEFFGESDLPASGPKIGKRLPYSLPVELVNNTRRSGVSSSLE